MEKDMFHWKQGHQKIEVGTLKSVSDNPCLSHIVMRCGQLCTEVLSIRSLHRPPPSPSPAPFASISPPPSRDALRPMQPITHLPATHLMYHHLHLPPPDARTQQALDTRSAFTFLLRLTRRLPYSRNPVRPLNALGSAIAIFGTFLYSQATIARKGKNDGSGKKN
ncbi:xylulose 5-phosphate/phosphate translocator, chloroplastic [Cinnamomum micranthum f. kanehirae]|uniref:Xylulose 5-phosphate/phosphate translocator, chloroplastic n=1 Tax=Cinnamomum micranthum f. kanehirae TaxID=337451 RepID=A0A3S3NUS2_9MAGN|nr:xylulose 5-phosphate/phosphate translocator, chloroplastic [Cinnamomum micranthum f. kanehirae]